MRSYLISAASVAGFLLLLCALASGPAAQAQMSCNVTYDCQGVSGCGAVMGGNITHRTLSYASQSACDSAAAGQQGLPTIKCSCGGSGSTTSDTSGQLGQLISTMTPQQQMGMAVGAVGTLMILQGLNGLMHPKPVPVDPAQQQRNLAAQQLNNSGIYLMKQKNYSGAINEFQQALAQTPNDANIKSNLTMAKQAQKNSAIAGQTSGTLGQLLGTTPAGGGGPEIASNSSPLNMVNLNGNRNEPTVSLPAQTSPQSLESQIDGALGNQPAAPAPENPAQAQAIDQIFNPSQAAAASPPPAQAQIDAEKNQVDDLFKSPGSTPASAQLVAQAGSGEAAANAKTDEAASAMARTGFDTAGAGAVVPGAAVTGASAPVSSDVVDLRQANPSAGQANSPVMVADLKTPARTVPAPEYPVTVMRAPLSNATYSAPGSPIFDCAGDRALIQRLGSGLPAQDEAMRRTEEAIKAAKLDRATAERKAKFAAVSTLLASANTAANWAQVSIARAGALRSNGIAADAANYKALARTKEAIEAMNRVVETSKKLTELMDKDANEAAHSPEAHGFSNAGEVESVGKILAEQMEVAKKLYLEGKFDDGLEKLATTGAAVVAGPVGGATAAAAIHTLVSALNLYVNVQQAWNSAGEVEQAEHDLEIMRDEQRQVRGRIYELQQEVVSECANTKTAGY